MKEKRIVTPMTVPQNETKAKALSLARRLLQTRGLNGFSFQDVADEIGIRKASLHYYFSSKDDLTAELLRDYQSRFQVWEDEVASFPARQKLQLVVQLFSELSENGFRICPAGALSADFQSLTRANQVLLQELHAQQRTWLMATIKQGQRERSILKSIEPAEAADALMALIQGGVQIARLRKQKRFLKTVTTAYLESLSL